jgi:hypothetical protein
MCEVKVNRKDYWFYRLDVKESSIDQHQQGPIENAIQIAIGKAGNRENEISYHLLKECITDPKGYDQLKQIFPAVIDRLNEWVAYKKIGKKLEPKDLKAITAFVNKNNFEEFLHYNHYYEWPEDEKEDKKLGKGRIQLNPKYYRLVKQVLDDLGT